MDYVFREVIYMHQRISIIIVWLLLFIFASNAYTVFLSPRKTLRKYLPLIYTAACILLAVFLLLLPDRFFRYIFTFSGVIIIFPAFFYKGSLMEKAVAAIIIYLSTMLSDMTSALAGYLIQSLFTTLPVTGNIVLTGTPLALGCYNIVFLSILLICRFFILPWLRHSLDIFGTAFFFRVTGPFLLAYLAANAFLTLIYSDSLLLFAGLSVAYFLFIGLLTKYALQSFRFFLEEENKRTQLELQKEQLELLAAHTKELSDKYTDIRRQNHDISGHLTALSHLISMEQWQDAADYIDRLIHTKETGL